MDCQDPVISARSTLRPSSRSTSLNQLITPATTNPQPTLPTDIMPTHPAANQISIPSGGGDQTANQPTTTIIRNNQPNGQQTNRIKACPNQLNILATIHEPSTPAPQLLSSCAATDFSFSCAPPSSWTNTGCYQPSTSLEYNTTASGHVDTCLSSSVPSTTDSRYENSSFFID